MKKLSTLIVDDEIRATKTLENIINQFIPELEIVGIAYSATDGAEKANRLNPDIILLDIEMPHRNGFDMLDLLSDHRPEIIFITAYDQYAIKAFKYSAVDYLLKPIIIEELQQSIQRIFQKKSSKIRPNYELLQHNIRHNNSRLTIPSVNGVEFIEVDRIIKIEADGSYCSVYLDHNQVRIISKPMSQTYDQLDSINFFKSHKSQVVNLKKVVSYKKAKGGYLEMNDGSIALLSRRKKESFFKIFEQVNGTMIS